MPPQLAELVKILRALAQAHRDLCGALAAQHDAMKRFDTHAMTDAARRQENLHRCILRLEQQRRRAVVALAGPVRLAPDATLADLSAAYPAQSEELMAVRHELRQATAEAAKKSRSCARLAGGVLSHLNAALRMLTSGGTYRPSGGFDLPPPKARLEAIA